MSDHTSILLNLRLLHYINQNELICQNRRLRRPSRGGEAYGQKIGHR